MYGTALCRHRSNSTSTYIVSKFNILYFNARSLNNKITELHTLLTVYTYDVILITESWLKTWHKNSFLCNGLGYFILRADRHDAEHGGGVCALIKLNMSSQVNLIESYSEKKAMDLLVFDLYLQKEHCTHRIVCAYLPPDSAKNLEVVERLVRKLYSKLVYSRTYIFGDFNFSKILWKNGKSINLNHSKEFDCFYEFISKNNLVQLVTEKTHNSGNVLDLVIAPSNNNITKISVEEPFTSTCDHYMINVDVTIQHRKGSDKSIKKNFYMANYNMINDFLFVKTSQIQQFCNIMNLPL